MPGLVWNLGFSVQVRLSDCLVLITIDNFIEPRVYLSLISNYDNPIVVASYRAEKALERSD